MSDSTSGAITSVQRKWYRLGVAIAFLWAAFVVVLLFLLRIDQTIGLAFAVVASVLGGVALTLFVLYVYR
ncbi:hypothetical protein [Natronobeatus ordinarius]|uniref:hypothetical protein n=1 Tax=Natronobeatus ordinarius TaxID=2963433 RepID=UPI0020CD46B0|nr:hypothetical protein [Natronobeatus ordinarius]